MFIFRDRPVSIMVLFAISLHYAWALILMMDHAALGATAVHALHRYIPALLLPWALITAATLASIAMVVRPSMFLLLLIPQQLILMMSGLGAIEAIWIGQFADGELRPRAFLAADQIYSILAAVGHTMAIIAHARRTVR